MQNVTVHLFIVLGAIGLSFQNHHPEKVMAEKELRIMSYNIRYNNPGDGERAWDRRKEEVANLIKFYQPDVIGLQEALLGQITFLEDQLTDYARIGVGREDGKQAGEYSPLLYRKSKFALLDHGTFWLSETPDRPSVGWDAAFARIVTWGKFCRKEQGDTAFFLNTHFDHRGEQARRESARLIRQWVANHAANYPVMVTGDFNASPTSDPYQAITQGNSLRDAYVISQLPSVGPDRSFSNFAVTDSLPGDRIDYVFVSPTVEVHRHAIISSFNNGYYPSDHLPIVADVSW